MLRATEKLSFVFWWGVRGGVGVGVKDPFPQGWQRGPDRGQFLFTFSHSSESV